MRSVEVNGSRIHILGVVKGLVSEEQKVIHAVAEVAPEAIGVSVSKEQLGAIRSKETWEEYELSPLEAAYKRLMESFGEVRLPSPAYVKALELAEERHIPIIPIDLNDYDYTEEYCQKVKALDLVREGAFGKSVRRRNFDGTSPEALAIDWDRRLNRAKGFRLLERQREIHMAHTLRRMASRYRNILAIIEYERSKGTEDAVHSID